MPSPAAIAYQIAARRAEVIRAQVPGLPRDEVQILFGASLVACVATWDTYIKDLVNDFFNESADPLTPRFHAVHSIAKEQALDRLKRFNTPNFENTRNLLVQCTGFDPYTLWQWPVRHMNVQMVQQRLNEVLQVRHSFAHGFAMPAYSWTRSPTGRIRLTGKDLQVNEAFFRHLVQVTDHGMKTHLSSIFSAATTW